MNSAVVDRIGWSLIHFVWQGAAVALFLASALVLAKGCSARTRYLFACTALLTTALLPFATFLVLTPAPITLAGSRQSFIHLPSTPSVAAVDAIGAFQIPGATVEVHRHLTEFVFVWLLGVCILTCRLIGGFLQVERLKRKYSKPGSSEWQERLNNLAAKLGIQRRVHLLESSRLDIPAAIGVLRAIVILPCSLAAHMPPSEIESLLIHELAHIRRHDFLINMLQTVVETALFYHPAVWWISRIVRAEREHCCDDIAAEISESPITYARALASLEELRSPVPRLSMSAKRGSLMNRIHRLLGVTTPSFRFSMVWPPALVLAGLTALMASAIAGNAKVAPAEKPVPSAAHARTVAKKVKKHDTGAKSATLKMQVKQSSSPVLKGPLGGLTIAKAGIVSTLPPSNLKSLPALVAAHLADTPKPNLKDTHEAKKNGLVTADFLREPFPKAAQEIARQTGVSFVIGRGLTELRLTAKFVNTPQVEALNAICYATDSRWLHRGSVIYFERKENDSDNVTDFVTMHLKSVTEREAAAELARLMGVKIEVKWFDPNRYADIDLDNATLDEAFLQFHDVYATNYSGAGNVYTITAH